MRPRPFSVILSAEKAVFFSYKFQRWGETLWLC
nr:MAG TPA: hypothetical protein [Caudoviricetes sp.]